MIALALALVVATPGRVVESFAVNVDADPQLERLQTVEVVHPNPYGGTKPLRRRYVRIVDGTHTARISPVMDYVRAHVVTHLEPPFGRGVWYDGGTGNGGAAPRALGLVAWTGRRPHVLWWYASGSSSLGRRHDGAAAGFFQDAAHGGPGPEIKLKEGVSRPGDPKCCPYAHRISLYRLDAPGTAYRLYARRIVRR
ncbi:MAG TPA: hypothetical protein VF101_19070 [Gaiellaceae bacterium]